MTSVPLSKAGVGSAVNDTTRELGGALGIALLGSIANTAYRGNIDLSGLQVPAPARAVAEESIGGARVVASQIPGGQEIVTRAASAFSDAFRLTNVVAVGIALVAAGAVLAFSRRSKVETVEVFEPIEVFDEYQRSLALTDAAE
jgi:hypothetical protein